MVAVSASDVTLAGFILLALLIVAAIWLARHDKVTRVKLGIFFERERERQEEEPSEQTTKIWPGQREEDR